MDGQTVRDEKAVTPRRWTQGEPTRAASAVFLIVLAATVVHADEGQEFGIRLRSPWFEATSSDEYLNLHALNWKKRRYE